MNCQQAQELLIELAYNELPPDRRPELDAHVQNCPQCRRELDMLLRARRALALHRGQETPMTTVALPQLAPAATARTRAWRPLAWLPAVGAVAALALLGVALWFMQAGPGTVTALAADVQIQQTGVSLTILSTPEGSFGDDAEPQQAFKVMQRKVFVNGPGQLDYAPWVFVNGPGQLDYAPRSWPGLALVRDQRLVKNLDKGQTQVRLTDVPAGIIPDSVRLRGIDQPQGLSVLEQNYQYDLASAWALLNRYIDQPVTVTLKQSAEPVTGKLMSFDDGHLVLMPDGQGPRSIARQMADSIRLANLPAGLLTKPTLVWNLQSENALPQQQLEVAYMTEGMNWRADYVLKLRPAAGKPAAKPVIGSAPAATTAAIEPIIDTAALTGYATVSNHSGVAYKDAQLKLMAGDIHLVKEENDAVNRSLALGDNALKEQEAKGGFEEKSFFEYHLYTLGRATTLRDRETKQIEMVSSDAIRMVRTYVYDRNANPTAAQVVSEVKNVKENGLGMPLPKGVIRLYAPDPEGQDAFVHSATIDHTPVNEKLRLAWGYAFDIVCASKATKQARRGAQTDVQWQYGLRNEKSADVTVTVVVRIPATTLRIDFTGGYVATKIDATRYEIQVPLPAGKSAEFLVNYTFGRADVVTGDDALGR